MIAVILLIKRAINVRKGSVSTAPIMSNSFRKRGGKTNGSINEQIKMSKYKKAMKRNTFDVIEWELYVFCYKRQVNYPF